MFPALPAFLPRAEDCGTDHLDWTKPFGDFWASKVTRPSAGEDGKPVGREEFELSKIYVRFLCS